MLKGMNKAVVRSRYEEDVLEKNHNVGGGVEHMMIIIITLQLIYLIQLMMIMIIYEVFYIMVEILIYKYLGIH